MELESKFIEGFNKQYSIRNDGVIIKHWHVRRNKVIHYEDKLLLTNKKQKVQTVINGKTKLFVIRTLLRQYFNTACCKSDNCNNPAEGTYKLYCDTCIKKRRHISKLNNMSKGREIISKNYVASKLTLPIDSLTEELYQEYKALLLVKRLLVEKTNCSFNSLR